MTITGLQLQINGIVLLQLFSLCSDLKQGKRTLYRPSREKYIACKLSRSGNKQRKINLLYSFLCRGVSRIFERGGGPISIGSLKKRSSDFKRGGSNGLKGGAQYICLTRTTNLAYLDAKE